MVLLIAGGVARPQPRRGRGRLIAIACAVPGIALPDWDRLFLSSGGYKYAAVMQAPDLKIGADRR